MATVENEGTMTLDGANGSVVYNDLLYRYDPNAVDDGPAYQTLPYIIDRDSINTEPDYILLPYYFDRDIELDFGNGLAEHERLPAGIDPDLGFQTLPYIIDPEAFGTDPGFTLLPYYIDPDNPIDPSEYITLLGQDAGDPSPSDDTITTTLNTAEKTGEAPMAGENENSSDLIIHTLLIQGIENAGFQNAMDSMGVTRQQFDDSARAVTPPYIAQVRDALTGAGVTVEGASREDLNAAIQSNPALLTQINGIATEAMGAVSNDVVSKVQRGEIGSLPDGINPGADAAPVQNSAESTEEVDAGNPDATATDPVNSDSAATDTANLNTETYSTTQQQIQAMQEVMMTPEIVEITGMNGYQFGNSTTGEADGIRGDGTNAVFAALADASGGRPDIVVFLEEQGVSAADAQKFAMAHASYVGAGNDSPIVLSDNPNAVADIQTAMRAHNEAIGLELNGIEVNTGSSEARETSDNRLGPLTARAIQGTVALAVTDQSPEGTVVTTDLTPENIGYVQAYLSEQGAEDADAFAANLRRIAADPTLAAEYAQNVVPDSIEYAGLTVPGSDDNVTDMEVLNVASVAEEVDGYDQAAYGQQPDGATVTTAGEPINLLPASLGDDFTAGTNGGLAVATMTVAEFNEMRSEVLDLGDDATGPLLQMVVAGGQEASGVPLREDLAALNAVQDAALEEYQSGAVQDAARAKFEEANGMDTALTADLRSRELTVNYSYTTGFRGDAQTHNETFTGSMEDFEEEYGSWNNQTGERELRTQIEAAYADLEASPEVVAKREEITALREEAGGMEQAHVDAFVARGDEITAMRAQIDETEIRMVVPADADPAVVEELITDAGGTYTAPEEVTPEAAPELMADDPAATGSDVVVAEDTTAPPAGELQALNTTAMPGMTRQV